MHFQRLIVLALDLQFGLEFFDEQFQARDFGLEFLDVAAAGLWAVWSCDIEIVSRWLRDRRNVLWLKARSRWSLRDGVRLRRECVGQSVGPGGV